MSLIRANFSGIDRIQAKTRAIGNVVQRPLRDTLDQGARLVAVSCAKSAVPYGTDSSAQLMGEKAVARDIAKVYKTPGAVYESISDPRKKAGYWKAIKTGDFARAQAFQDGNSSLYAGVPLRQFDGGSAHKSARGSNGRVRSDRPVMIVIDPRPLQRYVAEIQDHVGFGKAGWADVARQLGGIRGIKDPGSDIGASWITRKAGGFGHVDRGGTDEHPTITITNTVPYADNILTGGARTEAINIGRYRMLEYLRSALAAEMRSIRRAA